MVTALAMAWTSRGLAAPAGTRNAKSRANPAGISVSKCPIGPGGSSLEQSSRLQQLAHEALLALVIERNRELVREAGREAVGELVEDGVRDRRELELLR